ncbi:MAG: WD40/YVTN/BNR-like repeat-containing protein [Gemmatimonadaceae bacterium]
MASMGTLAIAASDTQQVRLGTGEPHSRNFIEPGAGIYKSTDGGITWKRMGLERTQHIGRITVDPRSPNVVYVAALGVRAAAIPAWCAATAGAPTRLSVPPASAKAVVARDVMRPLDLFLVRPRVRDLAAPRGRAPSCA